MWPTAPASPPSLSFTGIMNMQYYACRLASVFPHPDQMNNLNVETGVHSPVLAQGLAYSKGLLIVCRVWMNMDTGREETRPFPHCFLTA